MNEPALERLVRRDRVVALAVLTAVAGFSWLWLIAMAQEMEGAGHAGMAGFGAMMAGPAASWSVGHAAAMFVMWTVMMVGMMLPGGAPAILLYGRLVRRQRHLGRVLAPVTVFAAGYLVAWTGFSAAATAAQWGFDATGLLSSTMRTRSPWIAGSLLIAAGLYQWSPMKHACLAHCRAPMEFLSRSLRPGAAGALRAGIVHGLYCVGCCWLLMLILFVGGVMNLTLVAAIAAFVLIEKAAPFGAAAGRAAGGMAVLAGAALITVTT